MAVLGLLTCAAALAVAGVSDAMPTLGPFKQAPAAHAAPLPSSPSATELRDVAPEEAIVLNARIPLATLPTSAAAAFSMGGASAASRAQALECLTSAIYYEAGQESAEGQRAVAQVILNRVRHPAYPSSVCGVVFQGSTRTTGCQFTFTCDGSMAYAPMASAWNRAREVAVAALAGSVYAPVGLATHYHANYVLPYWASSLVKTRIEGAHLFYRWAGGWGRPAAFHQAYSAREADARALRAAALAVEHVVPKVLAPATELAAVKALDEIEGVKVAEAGKRVSIRFSPQAREAVEKIKLTPYIERVSASDKLRHALDGAGPTGDEAKPFGPPADAASKPAAQAN
jgi:spore germination cell wall hydrolase CwlJ-like protein